jgi:lipopolysaccharide export LptBFGC system permease protein LptF
MKILRRYVLREWLVAFAGTHLVLTCLLLLEDVYKNSHHFIKAWAPVHASVKYYALLSASFFPTVTPIAVFVSTLFLLSRLRSKNEITAMECAAMSTLEIVKPLVVSCAVLVPINLFFDIAILPRVMDYVTEFRDRADSKAASQKNAKNLGLNNRLERRVWFFRTFDKLFHGAEDVTVNCYTADGKEESRIFASEARFVHPENHWKFFRGSVTTFDQTSGLPIGVECFGEKDFDAFTENPKIIISSAKKPKNLLFSEILGMAKYCGKDFVSNAFLVKFHGTFANAARCLIVLFFAVPFAVTGAAGSALGRSARACGFFVLFSTCDVIFATLGNNGMLSPPVAAWGATALVALPIYGLFRKAM